MGTEQWWAQHQQIVCGLVTDMISDSVAKRSMLYELEIRRWKIFYEIWCDFFCCGLKKKSNAKSTNASAVRSILCCPVLVQPPSPKLHLSSSVLILHLHLSHIHHIRSSSIEGKAKHTETLNHGLKTVIVSIFAFQHLAQVVLYVLRPVSQTRMTT